MKFLNLSFLSIMLILSLSAIISCNKKQQTQNDVKPKTPALRIIEDDEELETTIEWFYETMQAFHETDSVTDEPISPDSIELLVEATYNYYVARADYEKSEQRVELNISRSLNSNGELYLHQVSEVFWEIKDGLVSVYDGISYQDKALTHFDLEVEVDGNNLLFHVIAFISKGNPVINTTTGDNGDLIFNAASNHAWGTIIKSSLNENLAQCDIDHNNKTATNINANLPGAWECLKILGTHNYVNKYPTAMASTQKLVKDVGSYPSYFGAWTAGVVTSPNSEYTNMNIPGYNQTQTGPNPDDNLYAINGQMWQTWAFAADPDLVYKEWLTTGMMNFYLAQIPMLIHNKVPSGKVLVSFEVGGYTSGWVPLPANNYKTGSFRTEANPYAQSATHMTLHYDIKLGSLTTVYLPNGKPLPTL